MVEKAIKLILNYKSLIILLTLTFIVRAPSLFEPLWYGDEAIYLTIGQKILRGGLLYVDIFDHKTPGIYYLAAAVMKIFGESIWSFRFLLAIWALVSLVAFYLLAKGMFGKRTALAAAIILSALTSTPLIEGNIVNSEILMILPISVGIFLGIRKHFFLAGIFFSAAFLLKFPAIFDFTAFSLFVLFTIQRKEEATLITIKNLFLLSVGFLLPILLTIIYFASRDALAAYFQSAFLFNLSYTSYKNSFLISNGLLVAKLLPVLLIVVYYAVRGFRQFRKTGKSSFGFFDFLIVWLAFSFYGAVFGGRPYEHYLIQAAAPFSLILAVSFFQKAFRKIGTISTAAVISLTLLLGFQPAIAPGYYPNFFRYLLGQIPFEQYLRSFNWHAATNYALADFLKGCEKFNQTGKCLKTRSSPGDKLYVFSNQPAIYFLSGLDPASRYITFFHIAGDQKAKEQTLTEISLSQPKYILVEKPPPGSFLDLEKLIASRYNLFAFYEDFAIYKIKQDTRL